jgi:hypothetical protein
VAAAPILLTEEVAALAASLGLASSTGTAPYEPDAFIVALRRAHDSLAIIKRRLHEQNVEQGVKQAELDAREAAVAFRERRVAAHEALLTLEGKPGLLARLWGQTSVSFSTVLRTITL